MNPIRARQHRSCGVLAFWGITLLSLAGPCLAEEGTQQHRHTNALIDETSLYLLQHAHHPVDWMPWGEVAFAKAKREHKPIFLCGRR